MRRVTVVLLVVAGLTVGPGGGMGSIEVGLDGEFVRLEPGTFQMGSPGWESGRYPDEGPVQVTLTRPFRLQRTEVTQRQWVVVMGTNPSGFPGLDRPVECVSWHDVQEFLDRLNRLDPGKGYRLPTEAEWEYACRAGTTEGRYGELAEVAWCAGNSGGRTHPVGQKQPNAWGLYDMLGNVWEGCADGYGEYPVGEVVDPAGPSNGEDRVYRGGSWNHDARDCRAAVRFQLAPAHAADSIGFRLARDP